jgi:hypothetical protein
MYYLYTRLWQLSLHSLCDGRKKIPNIAQAAIEDLFQGVEEVDVYINNVGIFSNSWEEHLSSLSKALSILKAANFTVNPLSVSGASKKPIGLVIGSHPEV